MGKRWDIMRRSAWKKQGRKHDDLIAFVDLSIHAGPYVFGAVVLGAIAWGVHWVWQHVPVGLLGLLCAAAFLLLAGTWGTWEYLSLAAARRGLTAARLSLGGATLALGFASFYTLALR